MSTTHCVADSAVVPPFGAMVAGIAIFGLLLSSQQSSVSPVLVAVGFLVLVGATIRARRLER